MNQEHQNSDALFVRKRDGRKEDVNPEKITRRLVKLCNGLNMNYIKPVGSKNERFENLTPF
jgi:ribonucleoside-diphosphate reductase subunit M1